ncbi:MAG: hypothetical protein A2076_02820 [Geobacteraceae bacterium GWC2_53_11]|nr:MAG: hypothetical protein A2076_02820 [Geobacteraceae bacterium GWC2_53_11]
MEIAYPYFFLKADNLDQNLPYYIHNARSILSGEFPLFNFHQYLGTPIFSCIQSAALYLPNYLALFCSWLFLGHYYGAMEFVAIFHLLFAALGCYQLLRYLGLEKASCCFGALAWAFCGFVIRVGDGWIQVVGYAAYFPWMLLYSLRQIGAFDLNAFSILIVLRVFSLFLGNPPYFIYTMTFEAITVALVYLTVPNKGVLIRQDAACLPSIRCGWMSFLFRQGLGFICTFLIAAPLLLPAFHQISLSADRKMPLSWEEYSKASIKLSYWLKGLLVPFSPANYLSTGELLFVSHIGWLPLVFCFVAVLLCRLQRKRVAVFFALAFFSFLWANDTFVTKLIYNIPIYNRQRFPFKLLFFCSFFLIVTATYGFDAWVRRIKGTQLRTYVLCGAIFVVHIGNLLAVHIATPYETRKTKDVPYEEPLKNILNRGRIVTIVNIDTADENKQMNLFGFNFATLFGLYHFAGYETLVSDRNSNAALKRNNSADFFVDKGARFNPSASDLEYFRKWGVRWYVLEKNIAVDKSGVLKLVYSDANRLILCDEAAKPMVFWVDSLNNSGTRHTFTTNSINITTERETTGQLIVNVLYNNFFRATIDGKQSELYETPDSQMRVVVPPGRHVVKISYSDPYFISGIYVSCAFLLLVLAGWGGCRFKRGITVAGLRINRSNMGSHLFNYFPRRSDKK